MMTEHVPPSSIQAEEAVLGAAMLAADPFAIVIRTLEPQDFYKPSHQHIHTAMHNLWKRGERSCDPLLVVSELEAMGKIEDVGGPNTLLTLVANTPATSNADRYARIIQEKALGRRIVQAGLLITDLGYEHDDVGEAARVAKEAVMNLDLPLGQAAESPNINDFLAVETPQDWLVPGLLERGDRVMLTAGEGKGKSTLIRQLAVQFASGIHPWESRFTEPIKVLVIDVENSIPMAQRAFRTLRISARENLIADNLRIEVRTEGLDLTSRHDSRWLLERVASARPDLITIGPVYKLHNENPNDEQPARKVASVLDDIRGRYGCAMLIEAHSPHGTGSKRPLRPFGASMWMRWPEFGYGLRERKADPTKFTMEEWRGARDVRSWPQVIQRGGNWPWTAMPQQQPAF